MRYQLSIIIPTIGRGSLSRTLESLRDQITGKDEVIVIGDGPRPDAAEQLTLFRAKDERIPGEWIYMHTSWPDGCWGNHARDWGIAHARGERIVYMDDDDEFTPDALYAIRQAHKEHPDRFLVFRMQYVRDGRVTWELPGWRGIGTPMMSHPNKQPMPRWTDQDGYGYGSDQQFGRECMGYFGEPVYVDRVIALIY